MDKSVLNFHWGARSSSFSVNSLQQGCQLGTGTHFVGFRKDIVDFSVKDVVHSLFPHDWSTQLIAEVLLDFFGIGRMFLSIQIAVYSNQRLHNFCSLQNIFQRFSGGVHQRGVKGPTNSQSFYGTHVELTGIVY